MKIGLVIADDYEYLPFLDFAKENGCTEGISHGKQFVKFMYEGHELIAVKCGIGKVNAAVAAAYLISEENVDTIISFGLSGAVSGLIKNDIVVGTSYTECDFDLTALGYPKGVKPQDKYVYEADEKLLSAALTLDGIKKAVCGCGDFFLTDKARRDEYIELFGITEFDMETGAIASVCNESNVPFIAIRQISDTADDMAADSYTELNEQATATLTDAIAKFIKKI